MLSQPNEFNRAYIVKRLNKAVSSIAIVFMTFAFASVSAFAAVKDERARIDLNPHGTEGLYQIRPIVLQVAEKRHSNKAYKTVKAVETTQISIDVNDPLEPVNRVIFKFNEVVQALILRPLAEIYKLILPDEGRVAVHNFLKNLRSPVVLANDLLQGENDRAWTTTQRLAINTTLGLGGVLDVADKWGIKSHSEDLGQTFAVWGVPDGFYLVLPIFGPSNPRDAVGKFVTPYLNPVSYWLDNTNRDDWSMARTVVGGVDEFAGVMNDLQKLKDTSVDYYAALRSISRQKRNTEIRNGELGDAPIFDLKYDFDADLTFQ
jgi:phospholipid-binding lipoprotein MlaA